MGVKAEPSRLRAGVRPINLRATVNCNSRLRLTGETPAWKRRPGLAVGLTPEGAAVRPEDTM